ncbi:MAG: OmpA family protein [Caulobacterales bacterium]
MSEEKKRRRRRDVTNVIIIIASVAGILAAGGATLAGVLSSGALGGNGAGLAQQEVRPVWVDALNNTIKGQGFDWLELDVSDRIATIGGEAASDTIATRGFNAAQTAIRNDAAASADVDLVINNIKVAGQQGLGEAFARLGRLPAAAACQQAFIETLAGRFVGFERASARITGESAQLLDALSGVALRCQAHQIEVGGHTDLSGGAGRNLLLSQARADAVKEYLVSRNVPAGQLSAIGYGEERPIDTSGGPEADARNRRIEFAVRAG